MIKKISLAIFILNFLNLTSVNGQISFEPQPGFFRIQRQLPLVKIDTKQDILVSSFGAIINDGKDDLKAIQDAINAAKLVSSISNPVRVVFEKGIYDIKPKSQNSHSLFVSNANNVVFDGNGSEIINHNPAIGFFEVKMCKNIIFKDLFFDYAVLPFTQGKVTEVDMVNNSFTINIDLGFPLPSENHFAIAGQKWGCLKDATGKLKSEVTNLFPNKGWTQISGNTFKVSMPNKTYTKQVSVGDYFVQLARNNGKSILNTQGSKNITYLNICIYSSPAGSFNGQENHELNIINCKVIPKPGSGRVQSGNADIIHITGSYFGPWVQGCHFEGYTDDAVNLKHTKRDIIEVVSPTVLKVKGNVTINDRIALFNPRDGMLLGAKSLAIIKVDSEGKNTFKVTFDGKHNVSEVGENQKADKIYLTNRSSESFVFRNNTFKNGRRYGILLQSSFGQIKDCTFDNLSSSGIKMENGVDWGEGLVANNIAITDNTFINCGFDSSYLNDPDAAAISASVSKLKMPCESTKWCGVETSKWQGIENIIITNNKFQYNKSAINLQNVNNALILTNEYKDDSTVTYLKTSNEKNKEVITINCSNLHFEDISNLNKEKK
jgi:hypothetical protein